jgi:inner membrane protein
LTRVSSIPYDIKRATCAFLPINRFPLNDYNENYANKREGRDVKGQTHLAIGIGIGAIASVNQPLEHIPFVLATAGVASLAADLDGNNLLNKRITKTVRTFKRIGWTLAIAIMVLALGSFFIRESALPNWLTMKNKLQLLAVGAVLLGLSLRSQETLKNILMSIIGLFLLYYAATNEIWWLFMFAFFLGGVGWFPHRGVTHTIWALAYWIGMSYLLEQGTGITGILLVSSLSYLSHIIADMLTKRGVKFLHPLTSKVFRFKL